MFNGERSSRAEADTVGSSRPVTIKMVWIKRVDINIVYHGPIRCCDPSLDQKDRILKSNIIIYYNVTGFGDILDIDYYDWFDKSFLS